MNRTLPIAALLTFLACEPAPEAAEDTANATAAGDAPASPTDRAGDAATRPGATAMLADSAGREVGRATLTAADGAVRVEVRAQGMAPGEHGVHVHAVGQCDADTGFESAGDHLNPADAQHGLENPQGPHMGDLPNLVVAEDSTGTLQYASPVLVMDSVLDGDGGALVVHAQADDQTTDPGGGSGDRIACGEFGRS